MRAPLTLTTSSSTDPIAERTRHVKLLANRNGLAVSAVASAEPMPEVAAHASRHIEKGHMAGLDWFTPSRANESADLRTLLPTAKSVLSVGLAYWPGPTAPPDDGVARGRISRYAWGKDYHRVIKRRLKALHADMETSFGLTIESRQLVDTARVFERAVAARSGLGWFGKHACTIVPGHGSWVLLGELLTDLELIPDEPLNRNCGQCRICIDACPTNAIVAPYTIHAPTCISYLTIEHRGVIPVEIRSSMGNWVYGCDICQETCPYTGAAKQADDSELEPASINNAYPDLAWLLRMTEAEYGATYFGTAVPRAKRRGLARNAAIALGNVGSAEHLPALTDALATHDEPLVRGHAAWAIGQLGDGQQADALSRAASVETDAHVLEEIARAHLVIGGTIPR